MTEPFLPRGLRNAPQIKRVLIDAGFEVFRTRGEEIVLAERPRENLIMDSGVRLRLGEPLEVRVVFRAQRARFSRRGRVASLRPCAQARRGLSARRLLGGGIGREPGRRSRRCRPNARYLLRNHVLQGGERARRGVARASDRHGHRETRLGWPRRRSRVIPAGLRDTRRAPACSTSFDKRASPTFSTASSSSGRSARSSSSFAPTLAPRTRRSARRASLA